jgi:hypothetical protein
MKTGHFVWPVGLALLALLAPLAVAATPAADWAAVKDPHGFEVSLPVNRRVAHPPALPIVLSRAHMPDLLPRLFREIIIAEGV